MLWWIFAVGFIIYVYVKVHRKHRLWKDRGVPQGNVTFLIGNIGDFIFRRKSMHEWLLDTYNQCTTRYCGFYRFLSPSLLIKDVDIIKQITTKEFESFMNHKGFASAETDPIFARNLFSLENQEWREMRATLSPAFTGSKMRAMFNLIADCADQFTRHYSKIIDPGTSHPIEMKEAFTRFANDVIATTAFGIKCDSLKDPENEFYLNAKEASNFGGIRGFKFLLYMLSPMLSKILRIRIFSEKLWTFYRHLVIGTMQFREKEGISRPDMIHLLLEAKNGRLKYDDDKNDSSGFATVEESNIGKVRITKPKLTDTDLTAQATLFFIAGFDTSSTALSFMAYELAINTDIQEKLQSEIDEVIENNEGKVSYETILKMRYMDMVVSEVLRKWPPGTAVDRVCTKPFTILPKEPNERPLHLEKGDLLWIPVIGFHRDPKFFPDPERFDPERFNEENKKKIVPFTYLPFGAGPRNCIGSRFALLEIKLLFFHLLSKFDILTNEKTQIPFKFSVKQLTVNAENGYWFSLKPREN